MQKINKYGKMIGIVVLTIALSIIFLYSNTLFRKTVTSQVETNMETLCGDTANDFSQLIKENLETIQSIAYVFGHQYNEDSLNIELLNGIEKASGFAYVRFIDKNGLDHNSDGEVVDVSDREYFKDGMDGFSGITGALTSRFSGQDVVGLYAPAYDGNNDICGVMVGFLTDDVIARSLDVKIDGHKVDSYVIDKDGKVLFHYGSYLLDNIEEVKAYVDEENYKIIKNVLNYRGKIGFSYQDGGSSSFGYISDIDGTSWHLLQFLPSEIHGSIMDDLTYNESLILVLIMMAFILFGFYYANVSRKEGKRISTEENRNKINALLRSSAGDYVALIVVDLETEQEEQYRLDESGKLSDWTHGNKDYHYCIEEYAREFIVDDDIENFLATTTIPFLKKYLSDHDAYYIEYDVHLRDGIHNFQGKFSITDYINNKPTLLISIRDISAQKKERSARESELKLIGAATSAVYRFVMEGNLAKDEAMVIHNAGDIRNSTYEKSDFKTMIADALITIPTDKEKEEFLNHFSKEALIDTYDRGIREFSYRFRQRDEYGDIHWMDSHNVVRKNNDGELVFVTMTRPIDEEIRREEELSKAREEAEAANNAKSTFLFNMTHDIRTPMNAIKGFTDLAIKNKDNNGKLDHYLSNILKSANSLMDLINNVLDMARIESGKEEIINSRISINEFIANLMVIFEGMMEEKHLKFSQNIEIKHDEVLIDDVKLRQIFVNIISNAIKYSDQEGEITLNIKEETGNYEVCIADKGVGMSEEFLPHIFDAFERERTSATSSAVGTGLGMGITKKMVELLGGSIKVESSLGQGTSVFFNVLGNVDVNAEADVVVEDIDFEVFKGKKVLLAEDNDLNAEIAMELLNDAGFITERAMDGQDVLRMHQAGDYDLIIMDIQMPGLNGYEASKAIRSMDNKNDIPIIAMTANAFANDRQDALDAGMNGHIAKPIDIDVLNRTLYEVLGGKE